MIGALIEFNTQGRVTAVYVVGNSDREQAVAEYGLCSICQPRVRGWLLRLFRGKDDERR